MRSSSKLMVVFACLRKFNPKIIENGNEGEINTGVSQVLVPLTIVR